MMTRTRVGTFGLLFAAMLMLPELAQAETAAEAFGRGKALVAKGDLEGALRAYATAVQADRRSPEYYQNYLIVRRVIDLQERLAAEKDPTRWEYYARAMHSFYVSEKVYDEALALDQKIHARLQTASSAVMLAETQLAMNRNAEAAETLAALDPNKATAGTNALLGIALVRDGRTAEAKKLADQIVLPAEAGPGARYAVARLQSAVGNTTTAMQLLKRSFENVAPSQLPGFRAHARLCPEFAAVADSSEFAQALATESKVPESKCSGGSRCAGCPMRGKCGKANQTAGVR